MSAAIAHDKPKLQPWYLDWFFLRKLHSLLGLVPFGAFVVFHLVINSTILGSAENYDFAASAIERIPFVMLKLMEIVLIFAPLIFHGVLGVLVALQSEVTTNHYGYLRNHLYVLQRVSAWVLVFTISYHITMTWGQKLVGKVEVIDTKFVASHLGQPINQLIYMIFLLAAAYHLAYGLWNFACKWGICISDHSQKVVGWICTGIGVCLLLLGWGALYGFATYNGAWSPIKREFPYQRQYEHPNYRKHIWQWQDKNIGFIPNQNQMQCRNITGGDSVCR